MCLRNFCSQSELGDSTVPQPVKMLRRMLSIKFAPAAMPHPSCGGGCAGPAGAAGPVTGLGSFVGPFEFNDVDVASATAIDFFKFSLTDVNGVVHEYRPFYVATMPGHIVGISGYASAQQPHCVQPATTPSMCRLGRSPIPVRVQQVSGHCSSMLAASRHGDVNAYTLNDVLVRRCHCSPCIWQVEVLCSVIRVWSSRE